MVGGVVPPRSLGMFQEQYNGAATQFAVSSVHRLPEHVKKFAKNYVHFISLMEDFLRFI